MPDGELSNHAASPACDSVCCQHGIGRPETFLDLWLVIYPNACPRWAKSVAACPRRQTCHRTLFLNFPLHHEKLRQASCWIKTALLHDGMRHLHQQLA